ncbi:MAG: hypothetical protein JNK05_12575 [Myxococcales bacterium]|nr:hypothetical protein [Myxococcales bacterium]
MQSSLATLALLGLSLGLCKPQTNALDSGARPAPVNAATDAATDARRRASRDRDGGSVVAHLDASDAAVPSERPALWPFNEPTARAVDRDGDGVLDWVGTVFSHEYVVIEVVAHGVAGAPAALDDEYTRIELRADCPTKPDRLLVSNAYPSSNDVDRVARRLFCALAWGTSERDAIEMVRVARATGIPPNDESAMLPTIPTDAGWEAADVPWDKLEALARRLPPLILLQDSPRIPTGGRLEPRVATAADASIDAGASVPAPTLSPALVARCETLAREARALVELSNEDAGRDEVHSREELDLMLRSLGKCVAAAGGAWAVHALGRTIVREGNERHPGFEYEIEFYDAQGERVARGHRGTLRGPSCDHDELELFGSSDYDRDGKGELLFRKVSFWCGDGDGDNPSAMEVLTVQGTNLRRYGRMMSVRRVDRAQDIDGDGLLDLLDDSSMGETNCDPAGVGTDEHPVWTFAVHARRDGTFSYHDRVTHQFQRDACARLPLEYVPDAIRDNPGAIDGEAIFRRAMCARLAGVSLDVTQLSIISELRRTARRGAAVNFICNDLRWITNTLRRPLPMPTGITGTMR